VAIVKRAWWAPREWSDRRKGPLWLVRSRLLDSRTGSSGRLRDYVIVGFIATVVFVLVLIGVVQLILAQAGV